MEANNQIRFYEKFEFDDSMSLYEQLQRSTQVPFETNVLMHHSPNNSLIDYPPFLTQENFNNNDIISQTFENNNISCEADFLPWSECSLLCEECFSTPLPRICPTTITTTTTNNNTMPCTADLNPIPNHPTSFDQNELDNSNLLSSFLNDPNNHFDYFIDAPLNTVVVDEIDSCSNQGNTQSDDYNMVNKEVQHNNNNNTSKINSLHYEEIRKYFDMPVSRAAKELNVSISVLRRKCRILKIKRWPYRKIKSLESLVAKVKEMGMMEVVQTLEEDKEKLRYLPGLELSEETKRLRQVCFKNDHEKKRTSLASRTH